MPQIIEVVVAPDGVTTVTTKGFAGAACVDASRFIEEALGVATAERKTAEYHQTPTQQQIVRQ